MIDSFVPLATHSGLPHLSNEQRDHFNKQKIQNMNAISPFFDNENYNKFFGHFDNFQKWRVLDLVEPCIHPIHLLHLQIMHRLDTLIEKQGTLDGKWASDLISEEEYLHEKGLINFYYIEVCSNLDLKVKREYKQIMKEIKNKHVDYKNVLFNQESVSQRDGLITVQ